MFRNLINTETITEIFKEVNINNEIKEISWSDLVLKVLNNDTKIYEKYYINTENPADGIIYGEITLSTSKTFLSLDANDNEMLVTITNP